MLNLIKKKQLNNPIFFILILLIVSCSNNSIKLNELKGSVNFKNSKLTLKEYIVDSTNYNFKFDVENYKLGNQTEKTLVPNLANSDKGQHIHFITNNGPYSAHYESKFEKYIEKNNSIILAFLSRSYHESIKNKNAYVLMQTGEKYNLDKEYIFYSRPKGNYSGSFSEKILLDFYLVNTEISKEGNRVRVTINDQEFMIYKWAPYYIEGLQKGEATIKLELLNNSNKLVETEFNPATRIIKID
ncbi:MAG: hypothetical protein CMC28_03695 [Flavobacteriaceae bacterium]|nr:hypothetical protein [Flavobacteriaceae bacterium]